MRNLFFLLSEEQNWAEILNEIFALDMGEYENLGFGDYVFNKHIAIFD